MPRENFTIGSSLSVALLVLSGLLWPARAFAQSQKPPVDALRIGTEEVLLDLIVRDKKGRPVADLKKDEIEIYENGVKQQIAAFRQVRRSAPAMKSNNEAPKNASSTVNNAAEESPDPLRQVNLVTMVFERLNNESRVLARQAAVDFLKSELGENVFVAVYYLDQRLRLVQPFTANRERLRGAIESATGQAAAQFTDKSDTLRREMETLLRTQDANANPQPGSPAVDPSANAARNAVEMKFAEITVNTLRFEDAIQQQQQGTASIYSLLSLIGGQQRLYGRKTVLYFSEGLHVPANLIEPFRAAIGAANRAQVSFYAIDARGLLTARQGDAMRDELAAAARASESQQRSRGGQAVTFEQAKIFDSAESSIRRNTQSTLGELAESTGGFLIANTNDFRKPLQRIAYELGSYYEVSYAPPAHDYDGKFHSITVKSLRPDVVVQARSGYFALPPLEGAALLPYELPLLAALNNKPVPRDFDYRSAVMRFGAQGNELQHTLTLEVPLANISFQADQEKKTYRTHFALLALVKDSGGRVVQKFSQDSPVEGPLDRLEALKRGNIFFLRSFRLAPGRYTLETVVQDRGASKLSARRAVVMVTPPKPGVSMSSISVIKRVDPVDPNSKDPDNPLRFAEGKIVPNLGETILPTPGAQLSFYFVVYPQAGVSEKPRLSLEFLRDGEVIARATPTLTEPDAQGRISYIAPVPMENFKEGRYELRAVVQQGAQAVEEHAFFTIGALGK